MKTKLYKLLMFGGRDWNSHTIIEREFLKIYEQVVRYDTELLVISGGASGADFISEQIARAHNTHVARVDALWHRRGRSSGPQRNEIIALLQPDYALGFHKNIATSKGTKDMRQRLIDHNIEHKIVKK